MRRTLILAVGDAVAITLFAVIGLINHEHGVTLHGVVRNAGPVLAGWFAAGLVLGLYRRASLRNFLLTWALGVTGGVILRALILGRSFGGDFFAFLAVTLVVTLLLVSAWRGVEAFLVSRGTGVRARPF